MSGSEFKAAVDLLRAVRRFVAAEHDHAAHINAEMSAPGGDASGRDLRHSRDEVDLAHADLMVDFTVDDVDAVLATLQAPCLGQEGELREKAARIINPGHTKGPLMTPIEKAIKALEPFARALHEAVSPGERPWDFVSKEDFEQAAKTRSELSSVRPEEGDVEKVAAIIAEHCPMSCGNRCGREMTNAEERGCYVEAAKAILSALGHGGAE